MTIRYHVFAILALGVFMFPIGLYADEDASGSDEIFELMGIEKPEAWGDWDKDTKHTYFKDRGAYPLRGNKYKGEIDIERYFQELGTEQPSDWSDQTIIQRQEFIATLSQDDTEAQTSSEEKVLEVVQAAAPQEEPPQVIVEKSILGTPWLRNFYGLVLLGTLVFTVLTTLRRKW